MTGSSGRVSEKLKRKIFVGFCVVLIYLLGLFFLNVFPNNKYTVAKVIKTKVISKQSMTDRNGNQDSLTMQRLTLKLDNKGESIIHLDNSYSMSHVLDQRYQVGEKVRIRKYSGGQKKWQLIGTRRVDALWSLICFSLFCLLMFGTVFSLKLVGTTGLNCLVLYGLVQLYAGNIFKNLTVLTFFATGVMVAIMLFVLTRNRQMAIIAMIATLLSIASAYFIGTVTMYILKDKGLHFEEMAFLTRHYRDIFKAELLLGCLGAVMDVAVSIIASMTEIKQQKPNISNVELKEEGRKIGQSIMGPMNNVLLFSYVSGAIPTLIFYLRNNLAYVYTFKMFLSLEVMRALVGSIGIVLTVPITIRAFIFLRNKRG